MPRRFQTSALRRFLTRAGLILTASPILTVPLLGQAFYGSIIGAVTDPSSATLRAARVTLTNIGTEERRETLTDAEGTYQFLNLLPGNYRVDVELPGFKRATNDRIQVTVASAVRADMTMQVGDVTQSVEVQAIAPLLQTETSNLSQVVNGRSVA